MTYKNMRSLKKVFFEEGGGWLVNFDKDSKSDFVCVWGGEGGGEQGCILKNYTLLPFISVI